MRIKEVERTANVSWSPADQHPVYLAAGTAAQQLDATFSTSASLDIYGLNLGDSDLEMPVTATIPSDCRFHKLLWGSHGLATAEMPAGILVAGTDNGNVLGWNPTKLFQREECLIFKQDKHAGAVKALDFNPFQQNLLASGGSDSDIYIWDLNSIGTPMTPGTKSQPPEEVACIGWNQQVQHILASTFASRCVVWDLRKSEPIIKISDSMSRIKSKLVAWHPEVATQLCLSSEDDHTPVIQLWDLRFATSPLKVFENHQRGVLSIAWCLRDPDLLLSCGKDNRILIWNPNSNVQGGEVIYELPTNNQWCFDVQWCPRNPNIISTASFDGHISVYSIMGGGQPATPSNRIAESFNNIDMLSQGPTPDHVPQEQVGVSLQKPPKWLRKPVGASFCFGGKLLSFESTKPQSTPQQQQQQQPVSRCVYISQVVTETDLISRSTQLEHALNNAEFGEFCAMKRENCSDQFQENVWRFLQVNFDKEPRSKYLQLLGYDQTQLATKVAQETGSNLPAVRGVDAAELANKMSLLGTGDMDIPLSASGQASPYVNSSITSSRDDLSDASAAFDEIGMQQQMTDSERVSTPLVIPTDPDPESLMTQSLLTGNFEAAVEMCLHDNNMAEAILLAIAGGPELLARTQKKFFQKNKSRTNKLVSCILGRNWREVVESCDLDNWKEALAIIMTYASNEEFSTLCDILGQRLELERNSEMSVYATLCYVCSGNINKLVDNWSQNQANDDAPAALQDLVEKVMILRKAVEMSQGSPADITTGPLAEKLSCYSGLLASQGNLTTALSYLGNSQDLGIAMLRDRIHNTLGEQSAVFPLQKLDILPEGASVPKQAVVSPQAHTSPHIQQSQSRSNMIPKTSTPSVPAYYGQSPYMAASTTATPTMYTPTGYSSSTPTVSTVTTGYSNKGPGLMSTHYPAYPQPTPAYEPYSQHNYLGRQNSYNREQQAYTSDSYPETITQQPATSVYNPLSSQSQAPGYMPQQSPGGQPPVPTLHSSVYEKPATAWNDPPLLAREKQSSHYEAPVGITNPMMYGLSPEQQQQMSAYEQQGPPGVPTSYGGMYNPQQPQEPVENMSQPPKAESPKEMPKTAIPDEHKVLQEIFDNLINGCISRATSPQMKRKLEDVARKIELMYDRLRGQTLSAQVILGLHQIIQSIQQYDYNTGLGIYTQLVSQSNFSEISSFMPGLKVLLQTAAQLQVYVQ